MVIVKLSQIAPMLTQGSMKIKSWSGKDCPSPFNRPVHTGCGIDKLPPQSDSRCLGQQ